MAFAMASPIMDPEMFVLMTVVVGLPFTLAKTAAALAMGLLAGFATLGLERAGTDGRRAQGRRRLRPQLRRLRA